MTDTLSFHSKVWHPYHAVGYAIKNPKKSVLCIVSDRDPALKNFMECIDDAVKMFSTPPNDLGQFSVKERTTNSIRFDNDSSVTVSRASATRAHACGMNIHFMTIDEMTPELEEYVEKELRPIIGVNEGEIFIGQKAELK